MRHSCCQFVLRGFLTKHCYGACSLLPQGDAYDAFISVAQKSEDATFVETTKKDVAKAAGLSSAGVAVITNFDGARACGTA